MSQLLNISPGQEDFNMITNSMNSICDFDLEACSFTSKWAQSVILNTDFASVPPSLELISLFLAPVGMDQVTFREVCYICVGKGQNLIR